MILRSRVEDGIVSVGDAAVVGLLVELAARAEPDLPAVSETASLAIALAVRAPRDGHTCVDLGDLDWWLESWSERPSGGEWLAALAGVPSLVGPPGASTPFVLHGDRLYTARSWAEESVIVERLTSRSDVEVELLLGGPGAGKTTRVAHRIVEMYASGGEPPRLALAAPTGKAAARMNEALEARLRESHIGATKEVVERALAFRARTVDALLGNDPNRHPRYRYNREEPLPFDVVIVDEVSMMSSSLMARLMEALAPGARLLLVGDPNQLASVESGTVLADLAAAATVSPLADRTTRLTGQHRFGPDSGIATLAAAIGGSAGDSDAVMSVLEKGATDVRWIADPRSAEYDALVAEVVEHARSRCEFARGGQTPTALQSLGAVQVLCAHRRGPDGVSGWNARIEAGLGELAVGQWYPGRPVMVTRNDAPLRLANGDVGVALVVDGRRVVAFGSHEAPRILPATRLEQVSTVHALTIHKSQGSEYDHVIVVLPNEASRILSRELLYTAVTRARQRLTIVGGSAVIRAAVERPIRRVTGLRERLTSH